MVYILILSRCVLAYSVKSVCSQVNILPLGLTGSFLDLFLPFPAHVSFSDTLLTQSFPLKFIMAQHTMTELYLVPSIVLDARDTR